MPKMRLTDKSVRALKPEAKLIDYIDTHQSQGQFGISVSPKGKKSWFLRVQNKGKRYRFRLGAYPAVGLADAREKAKESLQKVYDGQAVAGNSKIKTLRDLAEYYLELRSVDGPNQPKLALTTFRNYKTSLARDVYPVIGDKRLEDIDAEDVIRLLDDIAHGKRSKDRQAAPIQANRTLELIRQIFNFGIKKRIFRQNPCIGIDPPGKERKGERTLSQGEIKSFWAATADDDAPKVRAILRLLLLTGCRPKEIKMIEWAHIDRDKLTIPADTNKNRRKHQLFLGNLALQELAYMKQYSHGSKYVFLGLRKGEHAKSIETGTRRVRDRTDTKEPWTPRDLRRTVQTRMAEIGIRPDIVDRVLNHNVPGVRANYDHYSYYPQIKDALTQWNDWLETLIYGDERSKVRALPLKG